MEAPAFEAAFGDLFKAIGGYHSAFGIINKATGQTWTLEYDAVSEVLKYEKSSFFFVVLFLFLSVLLPQKCHLAHCGNASQWYH